MTRHRLTRAAAILLGVAVIGFAAEAAGVDVTVHVCADADHGKMDEVCAADYGTWLNEFLARALP